MLPKDTRIFVAGHRGMVGSAIVRSLKAEGYGRILTHTHAELDLTDQSAVRDFFRSEKADVVFLAAAKVGGIHANNTYRADFIYQNLMIECNVIHAAYTAGVDRLLFLGRAIRDAAHARPGYTRCNLCPVGRPGGGGGGYTGKRGICMKKILALAALAALSTTPAVAEDRGFYWGFDLGQYEYNLDQNDLDTSLVDRLESIPEVDVLSGRSETSEDGFTWGLTLGYQFFRFLAVEAAWVDLGSAEYKASVVVDDGGIVYPLDNKVTADSSGATLSALGILPFASNWQVYGRVGVYFAGNDVDETVSSGGESLSGEDSDNTKEFYWGLGAGYTQAQWTLRLEWQQYMDVGDRSCRARCPPTP